MIVYRESEDGKFDHIAVWEKYSKEEYFHIHIKRAKYVTHVSTAIHMLGAIQNAFKDFGHPNKAPDNIYLEPWGSCTFQWKTNRYNLRITHNSRGWRWSVDDDGMDECYFGNMCQGNGPKEWRDFVAHLKFVAQDF